MRKTFIITLVLCVFAAFAYAQTPAATGTGTSTTTTTSTTASTGTTTHHKPAHKMFKGTVASVDCANNTFTVHPAKGADMVMKTNDKTKWAPKGKTCADITQGGKITGTYHNDGTDNWALSVHVWPNTTATAPAKTGSK